MGKATGHGGSITFSGGFTAAIRKISAVENDAEKVEDTDLSETDFKTYLPGDLDEPGEFDVEIAFDAEDAVPANRTVQTVTITLPQKTGQTAAGNCAGSGFIIKRTLSPELATNQLQTGTIRVAYDGKTGPAYTPATTS